MSTVSPPEHSLLGTFIMPLAQAMRERGIDALEVAMAVGIDLARAANPDWRVSHQAFNDLMERCVTISDDEAFGLIATEQLQPQMLRSLGLAWLASDTVYDGLLRLVRFGRLISTGVNLQLEEDDDSIHLYLGLDRDVGRLIGASRDYSVGIVTRMCRLTLGEFLAPVRTRIDRTRPAQPERWEYLLASPVEFDSDVTCITWSRSDIMQPLVTGDPVLARINDEHTQAYLDHFLARSTAREVVDKIVVTLPDGPPSQQQIAGALHVSNRTLQRKLREEGTSFKELLQDTRMQLARKYLRQPNRSMVEIAYLLGFSEPSTFSRAFKRWTGIAPAEYRESDENH